jgi:hypothetical protein
MADDTYTVQRSTTIGAPPERVYDQLADFHNWRNWSPWEDLDPELQRTYSGAESGTGAVYAWSGNRKAGQGRMEITEATLPLKVQLDLVFEKPWKARNDTRFEIQPQASGSHVTWTMTGPADVHDQGDGRLQVDGPVHRPGLRARPGPVEGDRGGPDTQLGRCRTAARPAAGRAATRRGGRRTPLR